MQTPDSNELTNQYRAKTLPEGWYYFFCGAHHIGYLKYPSAEQVDYAKAQGFPPPQPRFLHCPQPFIGLLKTLVVLAPVPKYPEFIKLIDKDQSNANES